jgi:hypothetical protein
MYLFDKGFCIPFGVFEVVPDVWELAKYCLDGVAHGHVLD